MGNFGQMLSPPTQRRDICSFFRLSNCVVVLLVWLVFVQAGCGSGSVLGTGEPQFGCISFAPIGTVARAAITASEPGILVKCCHPWHVYILPFFGSPPKNAKPVSNVKSNSLFFI